jgi:hypothetical protein
LARLGRQVYAINHVMQLFLNQSERLTFLVKNYSQLQTLRFAPIFALFMVWPWLHMKHMTLRSGLSALGLALAVFILWFWQLGRYYQRYGQIETRITLDKSRALVILYILCLLLICSVSLFQRRPPPSDTIMLLVASLFLFKSGLSPSNLRIRRLYTVGASALLFLGLLPALIYDAPGHRFFHAYEFTFVGAIGLAVGILDHLLLLYSFHYASGELHA